MGFISPKLRNPLQWLPNRTDGLLLSSYGILDRYSFRNDSDLQLGPSTVTRLVEFNASTSGDLKKKITEATQTSKTSGPAPSIRSLLTFFSLGIGMEVASGFKATKALDMSPSWSSIWDLIRVLIEGVLNVTL
ncbi:hypothetical protein G4B88_014152 [Cannabis sativa]|uniref:Uncharacterized protein n=1 Tax=Cannabis sativa TaxID=3483 RepID=A0A7J6I2N9_CANSA|nr:hypothetical protein G4B88_014152 [Cannabis sativa]